MTNPTSPAPWSSPETVAHFATSLPNPILMKVAEQEQLRHSGNRVLDIGCGAGCHAIPLARTGWKVLGLDLSEPMLKAATCRAQEEKLTDHLEFKLAPMDQLPVIDVSIDFIVAHGIWNLARSAVEFRAALREAARVACPRALLFIYTFSRNTFPAQTIPVEGESFVFTQFSGRPQCFLTKTQLLDELFAVGFEPEPGTNITEYPQPEAGGKPALFEGIFRKT